MTPERYGIYLAALDPTVGREIAKTRPVVVVSLDVLNRVLDTVVVCPLTTKLHPSWRSRLAVRCAGKPAEIAVDQIRAISTLRLVRKVDTVKTTAAQQLRQILVDMYGLP